MSPCPTRPGRCSALLFLGLLAVWTQAEAQPAQSDVGYGTERARAGDASASRWRVHANAGMLQLSLVSAVGFERELAALPPVGHLSAGGRVWGVFGSFPVDDGGGVEGGGVEAQVTAGSGSRWADARVFGAAGVGRLHAYSSGLCAPPDGACGGSAFDGVTPYVAGGVGLDVYPLRGVGLGAEVRLATSGPVRELYSAELGLRVRFAR